MDKLKKKEYRKHGKTEKYQKLLLKFNEKYQKAAKNHLEKNVKSLKEENPGKAYAVLKKMGAQPGDCMEEGSFRLINHVEANMSTAMSAEKIAEHFSAISKEYPPLEIKNLPSYVQNIMQDTYDFELPVLTEAEVWEKIKEAKKPKGGVPGDLPKKLINEFAAELAEPITKIFQSIIQKQEWPQMWKRSLVSPCRRCTILLMKTS